LTKIKKTTGVLLKKSRKTWIGDKEAQEKEEVIVWPEKGSYGRGKLRAQKYVNPWRKGGVKGGEKKGKRSSQNRGGKEKLKNARAKECGRTGKG